MRTLDGKKKKNHSKKNMTMPQIESKKGSQNTRNVQVSANLQKDVKKSGDYDISPKPL